MRAAGAQMMCLRNDVPLRGNGGRAGSPFSQVGRTLSGAYAPAPPKGGAFNEIASFALQPETLPPCQRLPPRGSWQNRQVLTEGVRPLPAFSGDFYFTQRTFFAEFYPLALKKYTLFFYLRVVYA